MEQVPTAVPFVKRLGLADVEVVGGIIRLHGLSLQALRQSVLAERLREVLDGALAILAAYGPHEEVDSHQVRELFRELQTHVYSVNPADSQDPAVRRWMMYQQRYLWRVGRWHAHTIGEECLRRRRADNSIGPDHSSTMRVAGQLAKSLRSLGQLDAAIELDTDTLARQRWLLGPDHPYTPLTAMGLGADKRALGWYRDSWAEEQTISRAFEWSAGLDSPATLSALNNLTLSVFLVGDAPEDLRLNLLMHEHRQTILGATHPYTLWSQCRIGVCLRELGRYEEALRHLTEAASSLEAADGERSYFTLRAKRHQTVAFRPTGDRVLAHGWTAEILAEFLNYYGGADPGTVVCRPSLAADYHGLDDHDRAVRKATNCYASYDRVYGEHHPTTLACQSNLSVYVGAAGNRAMAATLAAATHHGLVDTLFEHHPHAIVAAINYANALHAWPAAARTNGVDPSQLEQAGYADAVRSGDVGRHHPLTQVVERNVDVGAAIRPTPDTA